MPHWRRKVVDTVYKFLAYFGIIAYIPSVYLSVQQELWGVVWADTLVYLICIILAVNKKVSYLLKGFFGALIFFVLAVFLLVVLGPTGAGEIWLFAATVISAFLLGPPGAWGAFLLSALVHGTIYFLLQNGLLEWETLVRVSPQVWLTKGVNFLVLNFVVVIVNSVFVRGFQGILDRMSTTRNATIIGLAKLAEHRDHETGEHLYRIKELTLKIAQELGESPHYRDYLNPSYLSDLEISSILHDIGKVGISDSILLKPGPLDPEEFEQIKEHPRIGAEVISEIEKNITGQSLYTLGREIALHHHEKWDGSGYPQGLSGENIPLSARIVALADVYDALTSDRPYKKAFSHDTAMNIILQGKGSHFDPDVVEALQKVFTKELKQTGNSSL